MNPDSVKVDTIKFLVADTVVAAEYISKFLPEIITQLNIVKPLIICLVILILCDFITGTRKAKALKIEINSLGFRKSISKFTEYSIAILSSHIFTWLFSLEITLSYYLALFICCIELKSIWENVSQTTGVNIVGYFKGFIPDPKTMFKKTSEPEKTDSDKKED